METYSDIHELAAAQGQELARSEIGAGQTYQTLTSNLGISYANEDVKRKCTQKGVVEAELGKDAEDMLQQRLADMQRAPSLADLSATDGNWHAYKRELNGHIAGSISDKDRVVFKPANNPLPIFEEGKNKGKLDWSRVTVVEITGVGNFHKNNGEQQ
jgi:hypothetical protein